GSSSRRSVSSRPMRRTRTSGGWSPTKFASGQKSYRRRASKLSSMRSDSDRARAPGAPAMQGPVGTLRSLCIAAIVFLSWAGIAGAEVVDHAFGFDMRYDDQTSEVLDYRYGDSKSPVSATREAVRDGKVFLSANVNGPMSRGDLLYVKW